MQDVLDTEDESIKTDEYLIRWIRGKLRLRLKLYVKLCT